MFQFFGYKINGMLYKTLIRLILEYGNVISGPYYQLDINRIESVQRRATKLVQNCSLLTYSERLQRLNLPTLTFRRYRGDMIMLYQMLHGHIYSTLNIPLAGTNHLRGHPFKLYKQSAQKLVRRNYFTRRIINKWNNLPDYIVCSDSLSNFKQNFDTFNLNQMYVWN